MLIKVKVNPGAKKQQITKKSPDSFEIRVKAKPIQGSANQAVIKVLADYFKIPRQKIRLIKGARSRNKIFKLLD